MRSSYRHDNTNKKHDNDDDDIRAGGVHGCLHNSEMQQRRELNAAPTPIRENHIDDHPHIDFDDDDHIDDDDEDDDHIDHIDDDDAGDKRWKYCVGYHHRLLPVSLITICHTRSHLNHHHHHHLPHDTTTTFTPTSSQ